MQFRNKKIGIVALTLLVILGFLAITYSSDIFTDDVLLAVELLQAEKQIDQNRIYVIGHSLGGMLVSRIIENDGEKGIAGAVIMSAPSRPLKDIAVWQNEQMLEKSRLAGESTEQFEAQVTMVKQQIALLEDPRYLQLAGRYFRSM